MIAYNWFINVANWDEYYPREDIVYSSALKALSAGLKYGGYSLAQIGIDKIEPWVNEHGEIEGWDILKTVKHAEPWYSEEAH